jgi:hypothetical protein
MGSCGFLDVQTLPTDGQSAVVVVPDRTATADVTLTVYDVLP